MGLLKVVNCVIQNHHAARKECLGTRQMREFTLAKIIWLSVYPRSFGCHMITRPSLPLSTPRETKVKCHFLASVGACNMILHIHVMLWAVDSCQNRVSADQFHMAQLQVDFFAKVTSLLFKVKIIINLIMGTLPLNLYIITYNFISYKLPRVLRQKDTIIWKYTSSRLKDQGYFFSA